MPQSKRFNDPKLHLAHFCNDVWVKCPKCGKRAIATADHEKYEARLICEHCGYNKTSSGIIMENGKAYGRRALIPHLYFDAELWLQLPFGDKTFWALNPKHLDYMESYISAYLRESPGRTGFTMVEKLPKFMQYARNRVPLLKLIEKMRTM